MSPHCWASNAGFAARLNPGDYGGRQQACRVTGHLRSATPLARQLNAFKPGQQWHAGDGRELRLPTPRIWRGPVASIGTRQRRKWVRPQANTTRALEMPHKAARDPPQSRLARLRPRQADSDIEHQQFPLNACLLLPRAGTNRHHDDERPTQRPCPKKGVEGLSGCRPEQC